MPSQPRRDIRSWPVFATWLAIGVIGIALAASMLGRLSSGMDPALSSESKMTERAIAHITGTGPSLVIHVAGDPRSSPTRNAIVQATRSLTALDGIVSVRSVSSNTRRGSAELVATDGESSLVVVVLASGLSENRKDSLLDEVAGISKRQFGANGEIAGSLVVDSALGDLAESDLIRADVIAIPLVLLLLAVALRSWRLVPWGLASILATVGGSLIVVFAASLVTTVSVFAINVVSMFAIGLTVDYLLLIVTEYRRDPSALAKAQRTVTFSGLTVAAALTGLLVFDEPVLRSLGIGGIGATLTAIAVANTLTPALLHRSGHLLRGPRNVELATEARHSSRFGRIATAVVGHPGLALAVGLVSLGALASPLAGLRSAGLDIRSLPADHAVRTAAERIADQFPVTRSNPITVLASARATDPDLTNFAAFLQKDSRVVSVGVEKLDAERSLIEIVPSANGRGAATLVGELRLSQPGFSLTVAGEAAEDVDFTNSLTHRLPLSLTVVVLLTSLLLWALTGSVVLPLKAIAVTTVSLGASMGFLVWGFQDAHLSGLLNFTPVGGLEPVIVVLTCLFAFGLSTDYEVFLLSAVIEARDRGLTMKPAVIDGIERSGKIISTAALLLLVVFVGFATGGLLIVKQLGVGLAAAILIDATVVRLVLVPASLTLLKSKNWWSPNWLRQLHRRLHLNEEIS
jgi:putative drug exporter of the RND superfamily